MFDDVPRPALSVLVMHDIRARLYERRAAVARSPIERLRLRRQARLYADFERRYCAAADLVVTVSAEDAGWVARHYAPRRVHVLPLPVDADHFSPASGASVDGRIVFTGLMNHPPNSDAANYFAREVLPGIRARIPAAHFHIVGRSPTPEVRALAALPGVEVHADVPDIRDHIASASVIVAPLRFRIGIETEDPRGLGDGEVRGRDPDRRRGARLPARRIDLDRRQHLRAGRDHHDGAWRPGTARSGAAPRSRGCPHAARSGDPGRRIRGGADGGAGGAAAGPADADSDRPAMDGARRRRRHRASGARVSARADRRGFARTITRCWCRPRPVTSLASPATRTSAWFRSIRRRRWSAASRRA
jgi:hypothetical protein